MPAGVGTGLTSRYFPSPPSTKAARLHGGILLRTLRRTSDSVVISGPSLLVDEILRITGASNIADLVQNKWLDDISIFPLHTENALPRLRLTHAFDRNETSRPPPRIYRSPRIGLDLSNPTTKLDPTDLRIQFISSSYRAFIHPHLLTANGRGHTFLGVLRDLDEEEDEVLFNALSTKLALKPRTVNTYLNTYREALLGGTLKTFIGQAGKGAGASPTIFLRMTGAVRRYLQHTATS
jgi:hypothetical protein